MKRRRLEDVREYDAYNPRHFETAEERRQRRQRRQQEEDEEYRQRRALARAEQRPASFLD